MTMTLMKWQLIFWVLAWDGTHEPSFGPSFNSEWSCKTFIQQTKLEHTFRREPQCKPYLETVPNWDADRAVSKGAGP